MNSDGLVSLLNELRRTAGTGLVPGAGSRGTDYGRGNGLRKRERITEGGRVSALVVFQEHFADAGHALAAFDEDLAEAGQ